MRISTALIAAFATAMVASTALADEVVAVHHYPVTQPADGYPGAYGYNRVWTQADANNRAAMRLQDNLMSQRASQR